MTNAKRDRHRCDRSSGGTDSKGLAFVRQSSHQTQALLTNLNAIGIGAIDRLVEPTVRV